MEIGAGSSPALKLCPDSERTKARGPLCACNESVDDAICVIFGVDGYWVKRGKKNVKGSELFCFLFDKVKRDICQMMRFLCLQ